MEEFLSIKLRPKKLSDIIGQKHLVGENKIITNLVKNKKIFSMILYGKPGIGKTSLAYAIIGELNTKYRMLNAVTNNKKDFDTVIEESKLYHGLILIVDEIHRMNKDKQDILLPVIESGEIILIGITSSNPYHSINPAIRSRCQLYELLPLDKQDLEAATNKVISSNILPSLSIDEDAINYLISLSKSDLRYLYNLIEVAYYGTDDHHITSKVLENITNKPNIYHDKNEDGYYDLLSAFQKSIRGSDVHASLYYLARLILGGELDAICRRLSVIVYEDIGLANPSLGPIVNSAIQSALLLGLPEARIPLSSAVIQLALSPKSNSAEVAINNAINLINTKDTGNVPDHIKTNNPNYKYPHNYKYSYIHQQYLPDKIKDVKLFNPRDNEFEKTLKEIMNKLEK